MEVGRLGGIGLLFFDDVEGSDRGGWYESRIVVVLESVELVLQIERIQKERLVRILTANSFDGALDEGMGRSSA